ncbi:MAG: hypothetical protein D6820_13400, partial [Lentisphaerae bacterium]
MQEDIEWTSYLAQSDLLWNRIPAGWEEAPFVGNGLLGSMLFRHNDHEIKIQIGRGDVQEHRMASGKHATGSVLPDSSRLPIGYFTLRTKGKITGCNLRLDLWDAQIEGRLLTGRGAVYLTCFAHSRRNLLVVHVRPEAGEKQVQFIWHAHEAFCPRVKGKRKRSPHAYSKYDGNPPPIITHAGNQHYCIQNLYGGGQTVTAWTIRKTEDGQTLLVSVAHTYPQVNAKELAQQELASGARETLESLKRSHQLWWHNFFPKSFVSLPDLRMESFLWIQNYKMASTTMGG